MINQHLTLTHLHGEAEVISPSDVFPLPSAQFLAAPASPY